MPQRSSIAAEYPFQSRFLELGGHRYHYLDEGSGEPLLFVHGNPTWSFAWRHFVRELSGEYRCLAVDHIGCGLSDKPRPDAFSYTLASHIANLRSFVERLDLQQVTLVGHDWGGCIGMGVAGQVPERFARLVLSNTAAFRGQRIPRRIAICRTPLFGKLAVQGLNAFARAALSMAVERPLPPEIRAGYLLPYDSWAHRTVIYEFVRDIPLRDTHRSYATLTGVEEGLSRLQSHPLLLLWGERDWCFTTEYLEEFLRRLPQAEVARYGDAGHYVFEDARDPAIARLGEFLRRHPLEVPA